MALSITVTNAGRAALVNATNTGTAPVVITQVGLSASALTPLPTTTTLPGEFKRVATLSGDVVADDTIHLIVRDEGTQAYSVRSLALYLGDGTLFAIYGQAGLIVDKSAQATMLLAIDVKFEDIGAETISFGDTNFLNPPATTEVMGVVELSTPAEATAGTSSTRVPAEKTVKDAVVTWLNARFGVNNAGIWHPGNDGAGSAMDADLLDGQQGAYYTNIPARLGFTPINRSGDIMTGQLTMRPPTSGAIFTLDSPDASYQVLHFLRRGTLSRWAFGVGLAGEAGANAGGDFVFNRYSDAGNFLGQAMRITRATGAVAFESDAITAGANVLFHAGNDGAGSGVDADLLDGQQGAYYLPASTYTAADVLGKLVTVDGAGSGLDADLLDGQQGAYYTDIAGRLGFTPVQEGGGVNQVAAKIQIGKLSAQNKVRISVNGTDFGNILLENDLLATLLTGDGSGSGIDADLLDGRHASAFALLNGTTTFTGPLQVMASTQAFFRSATGNNPTAMHKVDGNQYYILLSDPSAELNQAFNGLRPFTIDLLSGRLTSVNGQYLSGGTSVVGTLTVDGATVWTFSNDGSGSGLDADVLDGQHGTYYRDLGNSTGTLPNARVSGAYDGLTSLTANEVRIVDSDFRLRVAAQLRRIEFSGDNAALSYSISTNRFLFTIGGTEVLALYPTGVMSGPNGTVWASGNDGAGSGMDADLLDGQQGAYYLPASTYTAANVLAKLVTVDGSGSGLDADLLDGYQGSAYSRVIAESLVENRGYTSYASGKKECWGFVTLTTNTLSGEIVLPVAHTSWFNVIVTATCEGGTEEDNSGLYPPFKTDNSFKIFNGTQGTRTFYWRTIGV